MKRGGLLEMKRIALLGSTGSIGTQALDVIRAQDFGVTALAANRSIGLLEQQAREWNPAIVCILSLIHI